MADKIVAEYIVKTDKAVAELNKVLNRLDSIEKEQKKTQDGFKEMSKGMVNDFKKVGAAIGLAFGAEQLISFGKEAVNLAAQAEGVERAFKRIGGANSANLLDGLRKATRGTVSDLQLMQKSVQASNFKIPLENLASLFEFAQARARETGESVEYLTNSIVLGIGRKSPLILDNLGISAVELRTRLKGVGVEAANVGDIAAIIGEIAQEELAKMGDQADTTADKLAQITTVFENMKVTAGEALINFATGIAYLFGQIDTGIETTDGLTKAAENLAKVYENDVVGAVDKMIEKNQELLDNQLKIAELEDRISYQNSTEAVKNIKERIEAIKERNTFLSEYIKRLKEIYDESQKADPVEKEQIRNIILLNTQLKDLKKQLEEAEIGSTNFFNILDKVNAKTEELNKAIAMTKLADALKVDDEEMPDISGGVINYTEEVERQTSIADDIWEAHFKKLMKGQDEAFENGKKNREGETQLAYEGLKTIASIARSMHKIQQSSFIAQQQELENQLEQGLITREEYDKKLKQIRRKEAAANKDAAIFQAVISTAQGVVNALGSFPFTPLNITLAGMVGAAGAAQIAAIASQPLPKFAEGVIGLKGAGTETSDSIPAMLSVGESVMTAKETRAHKGIFEAIRKGEWEKYKMENIIAPAISQVMEGGFQGMGASYILNTNWTDRNLLRQGDRNRGAMRDGFSYLGKEIKSLKSSRNRWN